MAIKQLHTYCAMCVSRCGVLATVEDGRLTKLTADPEHPNGCICVDDSQRAVHAQPLRRAFPSCLSPSA